MEEEMIPGGWNSLIETSYTEYYPDHVQSAMEKKKKGFLVDGLVKGRPLIPNIVLA